MNCLLDTCVISEAAATRPDARVLRWLDDQDEAHLYLSVISIGEIRKGIDRLPHTDRRAELERWLTHDLLDRFGDRVLPVDAAIMLRWGALTASLEAAGRPMSVLDSLIAATALSGGLTVVTRNESDFADSGVQIVNPWQ